MDKLEGNKPEINMMLITSFPPKKIIYYSCMTLVSIKHYSRMVHL